MSSPLRSALRRLFGSGRARDLDSRFDSETAFHIDMATERNIGAGMTPEEARRVAQLDFAGHGGREHWREQARDEVRSRFAEELGRDIRYAVRGLRRAPAFTAAAVATLALSIGATSSIFSVVNAALLQRLPYPNADRIVAVCERNTTQAASEPCGVGGFSVPNYGIWRESATSFTAFAAFAERRVAVIAPRSEPISAKARITTANLFTVLGARPYLGRFFTDAEDRPGGPLLLVVSYPFWQQYLSGDPSVVGRQVLVNGGDYTVIGITAPRFGVYDPVDVWLPIRLGPAPQGGRSLRAMALVKPGVTLEQADREMRTLAARRAQDEPTRNSNMTAFVMPLREKLVGGSERVLWTLLAAVGFLLLIACANVANLLLARAGSRAREMAVRVSLGASPKRLARQLLTESVVLSLVSAIIGLVLAVHGTRVLVALVPGDLSSQMLGNVSVDWRLVAFTAAVALGSGILFGLAPALHAVRGHTHESLKEGGRGGTEHSRTSGRMRSALVVAEMSLALVLLAGAGLMVRSFSALQHVNLGFEPQHALTGRVSLPGRTYRSDTTIAAFFVQAESQIAAVAGVRAVGAISYLPLTGQRSVTGFDLEGRPPYPPGEGPGGDMRAVTPGYFQAMAIPLKEGRGFTVDDGMGKPDVAIVSETFAHTLFPNESAVGHVIVYEWDRMTHAQIVGVVGDVHHDGPAKQAYMEIYRPHAQFTYDGMDMVVRVNGDPAQYVRPVTAAIRRVDPAIPIASAQPLERLAAGAVASTRLSASLFALFGILGLLLAAIGIYGVMSYTVQQRQHEIGVRVALGASTSNVIRMVVRSGATLSLLGIAIGTVLAFAGAGLMQRLLFGIPPHDRVTFATIALVLAAVGVLAAYLPARRAARVDPVTALRS
ncbi:MAG TPA: ABC transporter permease [Gemmatimonadaceae bacterium]|nr:ABC transporter permease [Gemmatimonadaceae bacterium]